MKKPNGNQISGYVLLFVTCSLPAVTQAATTECRAIPYGVVTDGQFVEPYTGGCKAGLADGIGRYTYSFFNANQSVTVKVSGLFRNGMLNGAARTETSLGFEFSGTWVDNKRHGSGISFTPTKSEEGTWRDGKFWEGVGLTTDSKGVKVAYEYIQGKQAGLCRADNQGQAGTCTSELRKQLNTLGEKQAALRRYRHEAQVAINNAQAATEAAKAEAERQRGRAEQTSKRSRSDTPTIPPSMPVPEPAAKPKAEPPKPKSTLDL